MNHPACSADRIEEDARGAGSAVALCVFHLIAGVIAAFIAFGALAVFAPTGGLA